jgi:hypothetical protein
MDMNTFDNDVYEYIYYRINDDKPIIPKDKTAYEFLKKYADEHKVIKFVGSDTDAFLKLITIDILKDKSKLDKLIIVNNDKLPKKEFSTKIVNKIKTIKDIISEINSNIDYDTKSEKYTFIKSFHENYNSDDSSIKNKTLLKLIVNDDSRYTSINNDIVKKANNIMEKANNMKKDLGGKRQKNKKTKKQKNKKTKKRRTTKKRY